MRLLNCPGAVSLADLAELLLHSALLLSCLVSLLFHVVCPGKSSDLSLWFLSSRWGTAGPSSWLWCSLSRCSPEAISSQLLSELRMFRLTSVIWVILPLYSWHSDQNKYEPSIGERCMSTRRKTHQQHKDKVDGLQNDWQVASRGQFSSIVY